MKRLRGKGYQLRFQWVPAHEGILGNELAHQAASEATRPERTVAASNDRPKRLRSAALRDERQRIQRKRIQQYQEDPHGQFTRKIDQALPQRHTLSLYNKLSAIDASILIQLRSGNAKLNKFLYRTKAAEPAQCPCGYPEESIVGSTSSVSDKIEQLL